MYQIIIKLKKFFVNSDHNCWVHEHNLYNCEELIEQYEAAEDLKNKNLASYDPFSYMSSSSGDYIKNLKSLARISVQSEIEMKQSGTPVAKRFMNKAAYDMIPPESKKGLRAEKLLPFDGTFGSVPVYAVKWFV